MTYNELRKIIDDYKLQELEKFYESFRNYDTSKFQDIYIKVYDNNSEEFYIYDRTLPKDNMTLEEIVDYVWSFQEDKGGSWQFETTIGEDNYVWFEISETLFDYDWY
jgi:hypothetical protein